jgi:hypothetical protein
VIETTVPSRAAVVTTIGVLIVLEAATYILAALLHVGVRIPLGFTEPRIIPAAIAEGLIGIFLAVSAGFLFTRWAWPVAVAAHIFALLGTLLGVFAMAAGPSPRTEANTIYHYVMLGVISGVLLLLLTPPGRAALGRR